MTSSFSEASAARIEVSRADGVANRMQVVQVALFTQWVQAEAVEDRKTMDYLSTRFPEPLATAFRAWQRTRPMTDPAAPTSPFAMPEYALPDRLAAEKADRRAETAFAEAVAANERGDNYTVLTVAFASVLFFAAMSGQVVQRRSQWLLVGIALAFFVMAATFLEVFPRRM